MTQKILLDAYFVGRVLLVLVLFAAFSLLSSHVSSAASITLSNAPSQLASPNDEYIVDVSLSISTSDGTIYYLRGVFYQEGTSNYCGLTWNGSSWFSGPYTSNEGWKNFLPVTISANAWTGQLKAKLDTNDSGCQASGNYKFRVQRFTASSSSGNFDSQNEQSVTVVVPTATPTTAPTATPTNVPTPTKTPTPGPTSTNTPTPTKTPTPAPTSSSSSSPTATKSPTTTIAPSSAQKNISPSPTKTKEVLGQKTEVSPTIAKLEMNPAEPADSSSVIAALFISIGGIILILCGILAFKPGMINDLLDKLPWKR